MNQEPSIRTISVKYTVVFIVIIGFLFLFSQILDNLFYDYTVIETEIVFIKRVDPINNKVVIELNEVTGQSNSLVLALQNNMQNTIEQIYKKINYDYKEEDDYSIQQLNSQYRQSFNIISESVILKRKQQQHLDSIYLLNIKNTLTSDIATADISIYSDSGTNFFDLTQGITLNNFWNEELNINLKNQIVTHFVEDFTHLVFALYDYSQNISLIAIQQDKQLITIYQTKHKIEKMAISHGRIAFQCSNHREIHILNYVDPYQVQNIQLQQLFIHNILYFQVLKLFFFNDNTLGVFYLEITNEKYSIVGIAINENNRNIFLNVDVTEDMISPQSFQQIELLLDFNTEHNILVVSFCKKYMYQLKIKPFMLLKQFDQWNPKRIKLNIAELEKEKFKKIIYSHDEQLIYILSEGQNSKFKMHLVDLSTIDEKFSKLDTLRLRMPYFKTGIQAKDFYLLKNQINNNVLLFLLRNGDLACIQPLKYGEGVLKKTFIIELLDIILTLSFIGFFRYLKKLLQKIYQKLISCCRRI